MNMKGNKLFRVTRILMIIGGVVGITVGVIDVLGTSDLAAVIGDTANFGLLMIASILVWASGVTELIAGIIGKNTAVNPEKVMACIVFGILTVALSVLGNILAVIGGDSFSVLNLVIGLILPVLYLVGIFQSKSRKKYGSEPK